MLRILYHTSSWHTFSWWSNYGIQTGDCPDFRWTFKPFFSKPFWILFLIFGAGADSSPNYWCFWLLAHDRTDPGGYEGYFLIQIDWLKQKLRIVWKTTKSKVPSSIKRYFWEMVQDHPSGFCNRQLKKNYNFF